MSEIGNVYNRLTVLSEPVGKRKIVTVQCSCENKTIKKVSLRNIKISSTKSCGCLNKELMSVRSTKHGLVNHPMYRVWDAMIQRCTNKNNKKFHHYGGRGIVVDEKWKKFQGFFEDMSPTWVEGLTLDRRDNEDGYNKTNCQWVTMKKQNQNKRTNRYAMHDGQTKCIKEWCEDLKLNYDTISNRIKRGRSPEDALFNFVPRYPK
jgi:hypothetical protein